MKKITALILVCLLMITSTSIVFAENNTKPTKEIIIINGNPDPPGV